MKLVKTLLLIILSLCKAGIRKKGQTLQKSLTSYARATLPSLCHLESWCAFSAKIYFIVFIVFLELFIW